MATNPVFVIDNEIVWLTVTKVGSPPTWQPSTNYNLGDVVIPSNPQPSQSNLMWQVVGFLGRTAGGQPAFPTTPGAFILDNQVEWECVNPNANPPQLPYNEYYKITPNLTVNPAD